MTQGFFDKFVIVHNYVIFGLTIKNKLAITNTFAIKLKEK